MPTAKRKTTTRRPATASRTSKKYLKSKYRYHKLGALVAALALSVTGAVYVFSSHAAQAPASGAAAPCNWAGGAWNCYYNSTGVGHNGGGATAVGVYYPSVGYVSRTLWSMPLNGHYGWYGPYAAITAQTIHVCWWYATASISNYIVGDPYLQATLDVTKDRGATTLWSSGPTYLTKSPGYAHNGDQYWALLSQCHDVHPGGSATGVEIRAKTDATNGLGFYMYRTTWTVLN